VIFWQFFNKFNFLGRQNCVFSLSGVRIVLNEGQISIRLHDFSKSYLKKDVTA
jgi:hypothetical protein